MKIVLTALFIWPCNSMIHTEPAMNMTIVRACPNTVQYRWQEIPETPEERERQKYFWSLPRDDRPPIVSAQNVKSEAVKKPAKKRKAKKRKRQK